MNRDLHTPGPWTFSRWDEYGPDLLRIVERLSTLRDGLNNASSGAEFEVCKLADQAHALLAKLEGPQQ